MPTAEISQTVLSLPKKEPEMDAQFLESLDNAFAPVSEDEALREASRRYHATLCAAERPEG